MKADTVQQVKTAVENWEYRQSLPHEWFGFKLQSLMQVYGDFYDLFVYENDKTRRKVTVYYHDETHEYKLRIAVGLTEFCDVDFITPDLASLEIVFKARFAPVLERLAVFDRQNIDSLVIDKQIIEWNYLDKLPAVIEGFTLFIKPNEPLRSINGSYIVFDYCDFANASNFVIYYNIFRDEFFGEAQVRRIPEMNYLFDSHKLTDLEEKLDLYLIPRLHELRQKLNNSGAWALESR